MRYGQDFSLSLSHVRARGNEAKRVKAISEKVFSEKSAGDFHPSRENENEIGHTRNSRLTRVLPLTRPCAISWRDPRSIRPGWSPGACTGALLMRYCSGGTKLSRPTPIGTDNPRTNMNAFRNTIGFGSPSRRPPSRATLCNFVSTLRGGGLRHRSKLLWERRGGPIKVLGAVTEHCSQNIRIAVAGVEGT